MAIVTATETKVNLVPGTTLPVVHVSQYDTGGGRPLKFRVYNGTSEYTIPSNLAVTLEGTKKDGTGFSFTCSYSGSVVTNSNYSKQATAVVGANYMQLVFTDKSGNRTGSIGMILYVQQAGLDDDDVKLSENDIIAINEAQAKYNQLLARVNNLIANTGDSNSEIVDARLGADGVTYKTLGEADRNQFEALFKYRTVGGNSYVRDIVTPLAVYNKTYSKTQTISQIGLNVEDEFVSPQLYHSCKKGDRINIDSDITFDNITYSSFVLQLITYDSNKTRTNAINWVSDAATDIGYHHYYDINDDSTYFRVSLYVNKSSSDESITWTMHINSFVAYIGEPNVEDIIKFTNQPTYYSYEVPLDLYMQSNISQIGNDTIPYHFIIKKLSTRAARKTPLRIRSTDILEIKRYDTALGIGIYGIDLDGTRTTISNGFALWENTINYNTYIKGWDGYALIYVRTQNDTKDITTYTTDEIAEKIKIVMHSYYPYESDFVIDDFVIGEVVTGNNSSVSFNSHSSYFRTNFIPVSEGDIFYYSTPLDGIATRGNIRGIAGFYTADVSGFRKWLYNIEINDPTLTKDNTVIISNAKIVIPRGINYIVADGNISRFDAVQQSFVLRKAPLEEKVNHIISESDSIDVDRQVIHFAMPTSKNIGDCLLFMLPSGKTIMIDTGENTTIAKNSIIECLGTLSISHLDIFIISHHHSDHVGNIDWFVDNGYIDKDTTTYLPKDPPSDYMTNRPTDLKESTVTNCLTKIKNSGCTVVYPTEGQIVSVDEVDIKFFNTNIDSLFENNKDYNSTSLCCFIIYGNEVMCCTGDAYFDQYLEEESLIRCNILKSPHHCGHGSIMNKAIRYLTPEIVITSLGSDYTSLSDSDFANGVFIKNTTDTLQTYLESHNIPNYITGYNNKPIYMDISKDSWQIINNVRQTDRKYEGWIS